MTLDKAKKTFNKRLEEYKQELEIELSDHVDEPRIAFLQQSIEAIDMILRELERQETELQQVLNDYQELGKDYHKLECESERKDTEINKLNNVIDRMIKHIVEQTYRDLEECEFEDKYNIKCNSSKRTCDDCIKEYFMNKTDIGKEVIK